MKEVKADDINKLMDTLRPGDALVTKSAGFPTAAIRFFTGSPYTHVECYAGELFGKSILVGAGPVFAGVFSKVRLIPLSSVQADFVVMRPYSWVVEDQELIAAFMVQHLEEEYGYLEYIPIAYRIALQWLNKKFGLSITVPTKDGSPSEWVCSELYAAGCEYANTMTSRSGSFWGVEPINIYPSSIVDSPKMRKIASKDGENITFY
jgi:hypothetical protein